MSTFLQLFVVSIPIFVLADLLWLGVIARNFYQTRLGYLLGDVVWPAAILFYVLFIFGLTYFVTYPHFSDGIGKVAVTGLLFGLITYATYDLTNHATVRDWPLVVTIVDICWGAILGVLVSTLAYSVVHLIQRGVV